MVGVKTDQLSPFPLSLPLALPLASLSLALSLNDGVQPHDAGAQRAALQHDAADQGLGGPDHLAAR